MAKSVLFEDVFTIVGQFGDWVIEQLQLDEFLEGEDRSERLQCLDVIVVEQKLRKICVFGDGAERSIVEPA